MSGRLNSAMVGLGETPVKGAAAAAEEKVEKRADYLSWEDYFMAVASLSAQRSKDPSTQVGACIVSAERKVLGMGYNGMPLGCSDDELPWGKASADPLQRKYAFVCHAEMNAIMNKISAELKGSTMYATLFPCNECAKLIIQAGIREVVYLADKPDKAEMRAARLLFRLADVRCRPFASATTHLTLSLRPDTPSTIHRVGGRDDSAGGEAQASSSGPGGEPEETSAPTVDSPPKQPKLDRTSE